MNKTKHIVEMRVEHPSVAIDKRRKELERSLT